MSRTESHLLLSNPDGRPLPQKGLDASHGSIQDEEGNTSRLVLGTSARQNTTLGAPGKYSAAHDRTRTDEQTTDPACDMSVGFFDEQYVNMARHNLASEAGASIIWGQRELQLREGMLSVFLKDDTARNIVFQSTNIVEDDGQA